MSTFVKYIIRNITSKKGRSLVILLSLITLSFVAFLCIGMSEEISLKYEATLRTIYGDGDILITYESESVKGWSQVLEDEFIANRSLEISNTIVQMELMDTQEVYKNVIVLGMNLQEAYEIGLLKVSKLAQLCSKEIAITKATSDILGIAKEEDITLVTPKTMEHKNYVLKEIVENEGYLATEGRIPYIIASEDTAQAFAGINKRDFNFTIIDVINNDEIEVALKSLERADFLVTKLVDEAIIKESVHRINQIFWIIFLFVFLIIFFIIHSLSRLIIMERLPVIGSFRSIGASVNMVIWMIVAESALYGLVAGSIGGILGYLLKDSISDLFFSGVSTIKSPTEFPINKIILTTLFILILQVLMTILPVLKSSKILLRVMLFEKLESRYVISKKQSNIAMAFIILTIAICFTPLSRFYWVNMIAIILFVFAMALLIPGIIFVFARIVRKLIDRFKLPTASMAISNIHNNKIMVNNIRLITMILTFAISIYIVAFSMVDYLISSSKIYKSDLMISNLFSQSEGEELIEGVSGITEYTYLYYSELPVFIDEYEIDSFTLLSNYDGENMETFFNGVKVEEDLLDLEYNEIILSSKVMKENKLKTNHIIQIQYELEERLVDHQYKIVGQCDTTHFVNNGYGAIISHEAYIENLGNKPTLMFINTDNDIVQTIQSIENKVSSMDTRIVSVEEYIEKGVKNNLDILNMVFILICIGLVLSYVGIINNQIISFIQRRKELAVLYSTSMSKGQLIVLIISESIVSFVISGLLSLTACMIILQFIEKILDSMGIIFIININIYEVAKILILGLISILLTNIYPLKKIRKMNVASVIKYE